MIITMKKLAPQEEIDRMVEGARAEGFRIMPLCPFVNAQRKKHPEWADAFAV